MRIHEVKTQHDKVQQVKKFAKWAIDELGIEVQPTIKYGNDLGQVTAKRTFGSTSSNGDIWVHVGNRNVADICRTLAHELTHHRQFEQGIATNNMDDEQHLKIEDDANSRAGRMMRAYGKIDKTIYESKGK
jgi:chemotaxis receptor (MCP) glutamine deamidase CheD